MDDPEPKFPIRRFDVFAEFNYLKNLEHEMPDDVARGRAIWAAKVVAGRRYGGAPSTHTGNGSHKPSSTGKKQDEDDDSGFRSVGGEVQTDKTFEKEIVDRMGRDFYHDVFHPAIEQAVKDGKRYEDIRDEIRKQWKK
jgi:hypothetical protein